MAMPVTRVATPELLPVQFQIPTAGSGQDQRVCTALRAGATCMYRLYTAGEGRERVCTASDCNRTDIGTWKKINVKLRNEADANN